MVEAPLGGGSSGSLHRALDPRCGRRVALRCGTSGSDTSGSGTSGSGSAGSDADRGGWIGLPGPADLAGEAAALTASAHPHVVAVHGSEGCEEPGGRPWLAMALVDGPDLRTVLGGRPLPVARAVLLLGQLAGAVDAVHAAGFVHLDLKPANVLVATAPGGTDHVVLVDFGLARRYGPTGPADLTGDFVGSPSYAAPEHLRGDPVGPRADVYAFTCLAVACLTGTPPHGGGVAAVLAAHLAGVVPPTGLGPGVDAVVRRGMAADPEARFASAGDTARALGAVLSPSSAPPVRLRAPVPPASVDWARRGRTDGGPRARVVLVVLLAVLAVGVVVAVLATL